MSSGASASPADARRGGLFLRIYLTFILTVVAFAALVAGSFFGGLGPGGFFAAGFAAGFFGAASFAAAAGAVVDGPTPELVLNPDVVRAYGIDQGYLEREQERQLAEIARRRAAYLGNRPRAVVAGHSAIVIDDGNPADRASSQIAVAASIRP